MSKLAITQQELLKIASNLKIFVNNTPQLPEARVDEAAKPINNRQNPVNSSIIQGSTEKVRKKKMQKQSNPELTDSKIWQEAKQFFTLSPDMLGLLGLNGEFRHINPAFEKILGYKSEELIGKNFFDFVHPQEQTSTLETWQNLSQNTSNIQCENHYRCRDSSYKFLAWSIFGDVESGSLYAIARELPKEQQTKATLLSRSQSPTLEVDISAALVKENVTLTESLNQCTQAILRHLDALGVGIWTIDDYSSLQLNLKAAAGEFMPVETFPPRFFSNHELFGVIMQTRQPFSTRLLMPGCDLKQEECSDGFAFFSGYPLIIESRLVGIIALHSCQEFSEIIHSVLGWVANVIAVAIDRDQVREKLLSRREALLFGLANQIRNSLDLNTILGTAVKEIKTLLNIDGCHFLWSWLEMDQPNIIITHEACNLGTRSLLGECAAPYLPILTKRIRKLETVRIDDLATANLDPEMRQMLGKWGMTSGLLLPLKTKTGQLGAIVCTHYRDVRPWSEQEVELLQGVVDQLAIAIEHAELFAKTRAAALAAQTQARQLEFALQELQQTESQLLQNEKMATLGQMVAGIAHEINNPVNFITGNLIHANTYIQDLLKLVEYYQKYHPNLHPTIQEYTEEIDLEFLLEDLPKILASMHMGAERIHEIVLSLRSFSRVDDAQMKPVNIHEGLDNTLLILHNRLKPSGNNPGIMIVKEYGKLPLVDCYPGQINQVFMNIIGNAIDALENHSESIRTITICTSICQENLGKPTSTASVVIRICDNGAGMTPTVIEHLFDPFFTTKPVGKGTGLGLSISHQIVVEKHDGILKCSSELGKGSEFWIQIPIAPLA